MLANGRYEIRLVSDTSRSVSVPTYYVKDKTLVNIQANVASWLNKWDITRRSDGSYRLNSARNAKSIDVTGSAYSSGTKLQVYEPSSSAHGIRNQSFLIEETGNTATYNGTEYPTYTIATKYRPTLFLAVSGANIVLGNSTEFIFVNPPLLESGGVYEIRAMIKTDMTLDVASTLTNPANGTTVYLYNVHHKNNQKYYITNEGNGYSLRSILSGMYVTVLEAVNQADVQVWTDNETSSQRWQITKLGETKIDGVVCEVVSLASMLNTNYVMDVRSAMTTNKSNIQLYTSTQARQQTFALLPTEAVDSNMAAPSDLGIAENVGDEGQITVQGQSFVYPTWACPTGWASDGDNHYEWRYATRTLGKSGAWSRWSDFTQWLSASVVQEGETAWIVDGIAADLEDLKAMQYQLQVRSVGVGETASITSPVTSQVVSIVSEPDVKVTGLTWTRDGLEMAYESDYIGTLKFAISDIASGGSLIEPYETSYLNPTGTVTIPVGVVRNFPADGSLADVVMAVSTDVYTSSLQNMYEDVPVTVPSGGIDLTLTQGQIDGTMPVVASQDCLLYLVTEDESYPLGRGTQWNVMFPYDTDFEIRGYAQEGENWGVASLKFTKDFYKGSRSHGWSVDGKYVQLELREVGGTEESESITSSSSVFNLAGRTKQVAFFGSANSIQRPVEGLLIENISVGTWEDFESLIAKRGLYRAPYGGLFKVAITGVEKNRYLRRTTVKVTQIEVDQ